MKQPQPKWWRLHLTRLVSAPRDSISSTIEFDDRRHMLGELGAPAAHAAPPDRRPSSAGSAAPADGGARQSVSAHAVRTSCEGCEGQARTDAPARWRESLTFLRLTAGPTATDGAHPGCDGGATPGSHPDDLKNLRKSGAFQPPSATSRCELRTRNCGLSLASIARGPTVPVSAKEGPKSAERKVDLRFRFPLQYPVGSSVTITVIYRASPLFFYPYLQSIKEPPAELKQPT